MWLEIFIFCSRKIMIKNWCNSRCTKIDQFVNSPKVTNLLGYFCKQICWRWLSKSPNLVTLTVRVNDIQKEATSSSSSWSSWSSSKKKTTPAKEHKEKVEIQKMGPFLLHKSLSQTDILFGVKGSVPHGCTQIEGDMASRLINVFLNI